MLIVYGRGNPAPTFTMRIHGAFGTIPNLFIFVKVGARFPRPHLFYVLSDVLLDLKSTSLNRNSQLDL
jgi:hypothetical protein